MKELDFGDIVKVLAFDEDKGEMVLVEGWVEDLNDETFTLGTESGYYPNISRDSHIEFAGKNAFDDIDED